MADFNELALMSLEGRGFVQRKTIAIPSPAAGSDFSFTVDGGQVLLPLSLSALFTASAVVATRQSAFNITNADGIYCRIATSNTVTASQAVRYGLHRGGGTGTSGTTNLINTYGIPDFTLMPGDILSSATTAIDPGDQWSALKLTVMLVYAMSPERRQQLEAEGFELGFMPPYRYDSMFTQEIPTPSS